MDDNWMIWLVYTSITMANLRQYYWCISPMTMAYDTYQL